MSENSPGSSDPTGGTKPDRGNPWTALGGLVLGVLATWLVTALVIFFSYASQGDHATTAFDYVLGAVAFLAVPVVTLAVVASARVRTWFLIGFAVGSIVGSGVCSGLGVLG